MPSPYLAPEVAQITGILENMLPVGPQGIGFEHNDGRSYIEVNHRKKGVWTTSRREGHRYDVGHPAQHGRTLSDLHKYSTLREVAIYLADRVDLKATNERSLSLLTKRSRGLV
jgi:hypothetical protein